MEILEVVLQQKKYSLFIGKGILKDIGKEISKIYKGKKIAIITDSNVQWLYGAILNDYLKESNFDTKTIVVSPGEKSKSIECAQYIYEGLLDFGITRGDMIIAFGGGVVGDLAGFAASTLLRGIPFIQIPTTLLAQIDSSIGGKVAVNMPQGKNLIGSFYHPEAVYIDPSFLRTLDKRFLYDGMAEVIKYGCISDEELFNKLINIKAEAELIDSIEEIILICCSIKRDKVEKDEKDKRERMLLNFGHTIGHALENIFDYKQYTHGEAVAIGMYNITKNSEEMGITEKGTTKRIKEILIKYNLPYEMPNINSERLIEAIGIDKKSKEDNINIVLLRKLGSSFIKDINKKDIVKYL